MEERVSVVSICRRFEAAIDRIDRKDRPPILTRPAHC